MAKRIFLCILAVAFLVLAVGTVVFTVMARGRIEGEPLDILLPIILTGAAAALLLSAPIAFLLTRSITRPVNRIDPARPDALPLYPELRPMLEHLAERNRRIVCQMEELRRRETELSAITANMNEGLIIMDAKGDILACNSSARRMLDIPPDERLSSILSLNRSERFRRIVRGALVGERGAETLASGDTVYRIVASPVQSDGTPEGAVLLILDETEKERREALRREFTSNVSHEMKTPLTSISGFSELIMNGAAGEQTERFASHIHREAGRLLSLVNDILHLSRLDEGELTLDPTPIELSEIAREVAERYGTVAAERDIRISLDTVSAAIRGNRKILDEMLSNLVDNAIKYGHDGGRVDIRLTRDEERVTLSVADDGIGIPHDQLDRVFERFYRVDKSHSREIGGTGLGLSIVKHGAYYHRARIDLDSTLGTGTTVTLVFEDQF